MGQHPSKADVPNQGEESTSPQLASAVDESFGGFPTSYLPTATVLQPLIQEHKIQKAARMQAGVQRYTVRKHIEMQICMSKMAVKTNV
jgi:hypothetical protein